MPRNSHMPSTGDRLRRKVRLLTLGIVGASVVASSALTAEFALATNNVEEVSGRSVGGFDDGRFHGVGHGDSRCHTAVDNGQSQRTHTGPVRQQRLEPGPVRRVVTGAELRTL